MKYSVLSIYWEDNRWKSSRYNIEKDIPIGHTYVSGENGYYQFPSKKGTPKAFAELKKEILLYEKQRLEALKNLEYETLSIQKSGKIPDSLVN